MRVLVIGYSRVVQKRVLPALVNIPEVESIDIASQTSFDKIPTTGEKIGTRFDNYDKACAESKAELAYISTVNSTHAQWAKRALQRGHHVIVDKPACTSLKDAQMLCALARSSKRCVAESTVYAYHPQINTILGIFKEAKTSPTRLIAEFSFPPMDPSDFRYDTRLGGGALWDQGPYAVSLGRIFFCHEEPKEIIARVCSRGGKNAIDTSFTMIALYAKGRSIAGVFGFDTGYRNHLDVLGPGVTASIDRIYTTPNDLENEINVQQKQSPMIIKAPKGDCFALFLKKVMDDIRGGEFAKYSQDLLLDAAVLHRLRNSALEEERCP